MVSFKALLAIAAGATLAAAQGFTPTYTAPSQATTAAFKSPPAGTYDAPSKRSYPIDVRTNVDPYCGLCCPGDFNYDAVPNDPSCNNDRNNCFRAFLDARPGSPGLHCPSTAFFDCCFWYTLCDNDKAWLVYYGLVAEFVPWTDNCGAAGPFTSYAQIEGVVSEIDAVCACSLHHEVTVTLPNQYAALIGDMPWNPACIPS